MSLSFRRLSLLAMLALLAVFVPAHGALANSFVVSNLNDAGAGSLRDAIDQANASANTNDTITFGVTGVINLASTLPALTDPAGVTIDGTAGAGATTPQIELRGGGTVTGPGIKITSSNNVIRGLAINGFFESVLAEFVGAGIVVIGKGQAAVPTNNRIEYSYIGTDLTGNAAGPVSGGNSNNITAGIILEYGAQNTIIQHNVISGNSGQGILLETLDSSGPFQQNTTISDNKIGVNLAGTQALPNGDHGIFVSTNSNTTTIGPGNLISGNGGKQTGARYGVFISTGNDASATPISGNVVKGNLIGTDATGTSAIPNTGGSGVGSGGVGVAQSQGTTIGGPNPGDGNVISGNREYGVTVFDNTPGATVGTSNISIQNNKIGVALDGVTPLANSQGGVFLWKKASGVAVGPGNIIGGNALDGVRINGVDNQADPAQQTRNNTITGNTIGVSGAQAVPNGRAGVWLEGATSGNTISNNTIANNTGAGVSIQVGDSVPPAAPSQNTISANQIKSNNGDGVLVNGAGATGNRITQTATDANSGKGIALASGGNLGDQPNRPGLSGVGFTGSPATLSGSVTNAASCSGACTIEVFGGDSALIDEGPVFLGSFTSAGSFSGVSLAACKPFLIFTVTDSAGNTSEFTSPIDGSQCVPAATGVTISDATPSPSQSALPGATVTYTHTVTNIGASAGALTFGITSTNNWPTALDTSACPASLAGGASCTIALSVTVPLTATAGETSSTTITPALDGVAASAPKTDTTTALAPPAVPALSLAPANQNKSTAPSQPVSFGHTLTNLGTGTDSFTITVAPPNGWSYGVEPASPIQLAPSAAVSVTVTYTPTAGLSSPPDYIGTVTATSAADSSITQTVTDTITIASAAAPQISSVVTPASVDPGGAVQIDYTITNAGNISGTFDLALSAPGLTLDAAIPVSVTLDPSMSQVFSATLSVPAGASAGNYPVVLTATNRADPSITASKLDLVVVTQQAALVLEPDQTFTRAPGATYTDTLTLTNNGNFTDTVSLAASSSSGWSVRPLSPTVTLDPGASADVGVETTIPPGLLAGSIEDTTTITATSSVAGVSDTATFTTTIAAAPGVALAPTPQQRSIGAGQSATFGFTLTNSGSITQSFTITSTSVPTGWLSLLGPLTTPVLEPGETVPVTLTLTAPVNATDGASASVTLTAACVEDSCSASAQASARVGPPVDTQIGGPCDQAVLPGALITCRHTLTNTGSVADTFVLEVTSKLGWSTTLTPTRLLLAPGATKGFTLTLQVPTSASGGTVELLKTSARSTAFPGAAHTFTDTITVRQFAAVSFTGSQARPLAPGQTITFLHTLQNIGNGLDRFDITATQTPGLNWPITVTPTRTATLAPGINSSVQVQVFVPSSAAQTINRITLRATSVLSPTIFAELTDTIGAPNAPGHVLYLPLVSIPSLRAARAAPEALAPETRLPFARS